jgi:hypothetical protein
MNEQTSAIICDSYKVFLKCQPRQKQDHTFTVNVYTTGVEAILLMCKQGNITSDGLIRDKQCNIFYTNYSIYMTTTLYDVLVAYDAYTNFNTSLLVLPL